MNNKALTLSLVMGVLAFFFVQSYVSSIEDEARKKFGTEVVVLTASKNINEMETIDETMIEPNTVPTRFLEPAAVSFETNDKENKTVIRSIKSLAGAVAMVPIRKGEQITTNKLVEPGIRTGLSPQITPGRRAIAIPVNETSGVSKLVKPGDRVDVIAVVGVGSGNTGKIAKTVLQDVAVLSVGRNVTNNTPRIIEKIGNKSQTRSLTTSDSFSSVTIELEPTQAQAMALILGQGNSQLFLSLRNNDDTDRVGLSGVTASDILGNDVSRVPSSGPRRRGR